MVQSLKSVHQLVLHHLDLATGEEVALLGIVVLLFHQIYDRAK